MTGTEWGVLQYRHLDHHVRQSGLQEPAAHAPFMSSLRVASALLVLLVAGACRRSSPPPVAPAAARIAGTWEGEDRSRFHFERDGRVSWIIPRAGKADTFALRYSLAPLPATADAAGGAGSTSALDITGFDRGSLAGRTLYCLAILGDAANADVLRMDCAPGPTTAAGAERRPARLSGQARTYRRVR